MMALTAVKSSRVLQLGLNSSFLGALYPAASHCCYSSDVRFIKNADPSQLKKGRGGRSSFSGNVCTVFGATGFIGRYVVNRLGKTGTQMVIPYRGEYYDVRHLKLAGDLGQIVFCHYHLCDEDTIAKAMKYSNVVINMIGRDWATKNFTLNQVHVDGAARLARIAKKVGVDRFIHVSALNCDRTHEGVVMTGGSPLLLAKREGEKAVLAEFPEATIFRPSDVYGSEDRFLRYYAAYWRSDLKTLAVPKGGRGIFKQPVYVGDLAQGIVNAAVKDFDAQGQIYQAVGPRRYELRELLEWFLRVLRKSPDFEASTTLLDMKFSLGPLLKAKINDFLPSFPINSQTKEKLERETVTDVVSLELPRLEDLGVTPTKMEDRVEWELRPYRAFEYYEEEIGDFPAPAPPKYINA
ncbi:NAD(P)-binding domain [Trinorchestia longiramus]|nr:NAD(P)-binding domain [Trinorchestia longiramus]